MRSLLDTSVLIADPPARLKGELAVSAVSLAELQLGVLRPGLAASEQADRLARLTRVQRAFDVLPVDAAVAEAYGRLGAVLLHAGRQPRSRVADLLIAATAYAHRAQLVTRNPDDLAGLEGHVTVVAI